MNKKQKIILIIYIILLILIFLYPPCYVQYIPLSHEIDMTLFQYKSIFSIISYSNYLYLNQTVDGWKDKKEFGWLPIISVPTIFVEITIVSLIIISLLVILRRKK